MSGMDGVKEKLPKKFRTREIAGIGFLACGVFLFLCLISYYPMDPSFTRFFAESVKTHNIVGYIGSYTADTLIRLFGISVFLLPVVILIVSYKYFVDESFHLGLALTAGFAGIIFSTSGLIAAAVESIFVYGEKLRAGGFSGYIVASFLNDYLNQTGTYIVLIVTCLISLMLLTNLSVVSIIRSFNEYMGGVWGRLSSISLRRNKDSKDKSGDEGKALKIPIIDQTTTLGDRQRRKKSEQAKFEFMQNNGISKPPLTLLEQIERRDTRIKRESLIMNSKILEKKLGDFGVDAKVVEVKPGPVITMYELEPAPGVKINRITTLSDDLALALRAPSIRIIAPLPGKAVIGIEIPNHEREPVRLKDVLDNEQFLESQFRLPIALGEDIVGTPIIADLTKMPHLLIAGTTGSGKSVSLNAMICSILFKALPDEVKFLMIDPKRLELSAYEGIPHLLHPVVVDPKKAAHVLRWAVMEMERRYELIVEYGVKNIESYNKIAEKLPKEKTNIAGMADGKDARRSQETPLKLPYIVIIIDELADLMMVAQRNVEESLTRLAQMARAAGIHLILATQRPSVDVITGVIKANFPTRISFQVSSKVDSRTILDVLGAENLLGSGDMLFLPPGTSKLVRIHGPYVSDKEIERIVDFVRKQAKPAYDESITEYQTDSAEGSRSEEYDEKYNEAVELISELGHVSISLVQRYMKIGYNRAARIVERMEAEGLIGPSDGVKPRKVLIKKTTR